MGFDSGPAVHGYGTRRLVARALLLAAVLIVVAVVFAARSNRSGVEVLRAATIPTPSTLMYVDPATQTVTAGSDVFVDVRISNVTGLGAFEFEFGSALEVVSIDEGPFLGSMGRTLSCTLVPVNSVTVRFGCVTKGTGEGPSGSGLLATVRLRTSCAGDYPLRLTNVVASDVLGKAGIPTGRQGGSATVTGDVGDCPTAAPITPPAPTFVGCADLTGDGLVRVSDILYVLRAFSSFDPQADFDQSGVVNISDVLFAVAQYGSSC